MSGSDILFIVNPISGNRKRKRKIIRLLESRGYRTVYSQYPSHAAELAREASQGTVVAVGGDGTVNEVASGIASSGKKLGIIPCGSGDGLAIHLGIKGSPRRLLKIIEEGCTTKLDCCEINGKPFFSVCGTGLDAIVSERFAKNGKRGLSTYIKEALNTWREFTPDTYTKVIDSDEPFTVQAAMVTVGNSNQWGNGARIAPRAKSDDGVLDITIVRMFRNIEIPMLVWRLMRGTIDRSGKVDCYRGRNIVLKHVLPYPAHCDGDFIEEGKELRISVTDAELDVIVPKKAG